MSSQQRGTRRAVARRVRESRLVSYAEKARLLGEIGRFGPWAVLEELERLERGRQG